MSYLSRTLLFGVCMGAFGLAVSLFPFVSGLEESVGLDLLFQLRGERPPPTDVVIVGIDAASAAQLGLPENLEKWPRSLHARLVEQLREAGATVIAFDVLFDEERTAADDQEFANVLRQAHNVVLFEYLRGTTVPVTRQGSASRGMLHLEQRVPPIPLLEQAAVASAPFPLPKVPVKVTQYWTFKTGSGEVPTLPVVAFQMFALEAYDELLHLVGMVRPAQAARLPPTRQAVLSTLGVRKVMHILREIILDDPAAIEQKLKELREASALDGSGKTHQLLQALIHMYQSAPSQYLNYYGPPGTISAIPYHRVLQLSEGANSPQPRLDVRGKAVLVGLLEYSRLDQKDGFYTVFSQTNGLHISGVEIAATAVANLLEDLPVRPLWRGWYLLIIFLWGLLLGVVCRLLPLLVAAGSTLGLAVLYGLGAQYAFAMAGIWSPLVVPVFVQGPLVFFGAVVWRHATIRRERQQLREAFGYYLPDRVIAQVSQSVARIGTRSEMVYGICLFTDAAQYTVLAEQMEPQELGRFMNAYYAAVFGPVRDYGGMVSDVIGDAMLAVWATAQPDATLRKQACLAALDIARAVEQFKHASDTAGLPTRIGVHAGRMLLGNVGALGHYEYRAVGDIVNTASRVEGLNKFLGTRILVSDEVVHQLEGFLSREMGAFVFVGKSAPLVVHELLCREEEAEKQQIEQCALFAAALEAFKRQSWEEARRTFAEVSGYAGAGGDGPSVFYGQLCEEYHAHPPGETWDGVVHLLKK